MNLHKFHVPVKNLFNVKKKCFVLVTQFQFHVELRLKQADPTTYILRERDNKKMFSVFSKLELW